MDPARLRENFAQVAMHGDAVALFFYSDLFLRHPDVVARSGSWAGRDAYLAGPTGRRTTGSRRGSACRRLLGTRRGSACPRLLGTR